MKRLLVCLLLVGVVGCGESQSTVNLAACPDCEKEVSKRATACPHCGAPLTQQASQPEPPAANVNNKDGGMTGSTLSDFSSGVRRETLTLKGHLGRVFSVSFSPDGKRIVSGSFDKTVKVWDAQTGQETLTLKGHSDTVLSVSFSPDGKRIVSGSSDHTVKVWDVLP